MSSLCLLLPGQSPASIGTAVTAPQTGLRDCFPLHIAGHQTCSGTVISGARTYAGPLSLALERRIGEIAPIGSAVAGVTAAENQSQARFVALDRRFRRHGLLSGRDCLLRSTALCVTGHNKQGSDGDRWFDVLRSASQAATNSSSPQPKALQSAAQTDPGPRSPACLLSLHGAAGLRGVWHDE